MNIIGNSSWKHWANLKDKNLSKEGILVVEGLFLAERLLKSDLTILGIWGTQEALSKLPSCAVPYETLSKEELRELAGFSFHRGVIGIAKAPKTIPIENFTTSLAKPVLIIPRLGDPENLGGVLRTALAFGVKDIILGEKNPYLFGRKVLRAAMGAHFHQIFYSYSNLDQWNILYDKGYSLIATGLSEQNRPIEQLNAKPPWALLIGHEGFGLTKEELSHAGEIYKIPISPDTDSLNVTVAAGIFLHHLSKIS